MKYNYVIESIDETNSHGKILKQIKPGSIVLECGCATGYMTKYMKEKLGCKVYIIEYEQSAFNIAKQYAEDGICTDLMKDDWVNKFQGMKFDNIVFADVLEHLYDPKKVLQNATLFLKESGKILVSLPNIGHNDILLNLYYKNWNYTDIGLLDNTHIRFWGENNLASFFEATGMGIVYQDYTHIETLNTEQSIKVQENDIDFLYKVKERPSGEIYQFIIVAQLKDYIEKNNVIPIIKKPKDTFESNLFYKRNMDEEYNDTNRIYNGRFNGRIISQEYNIKDLESVELRFDPIEGVAIIVENIKVESNVGNLEIMPINGRHTNCGDVFLNNDPQYKIIVLNKNVEWIKISCKVIPIIDENMIRFLNSTLEDKEIMRLELKERKNDIEIMKNSHSWKITKPLRWVRSLLK